MNIASSEMLKEFRNSWMQDGQSLYFCHMPQIVLSKLNVAANTNILMILSVLSLHRYQYY